VDTDSGSRNLMMRIVAALILAPLTIVIAYVGGWLWALLVILTAVGLFIEWLMIVNSTRNIAVLTVGSVMLVVVGLCLIASKIEIALFALIVGGVLVAVISSAKRIWSAVGVLYAGLALIASVLVRVDGEVGLTALIFVLLIVWVTDIGGYFAGRGIGGPKLWPRVSPKKTWAGAVGGLIGSVVIAWAGASLGFGKTIPLILAALGLSIVSQLGDLFESAVKRKFGVKDSSHIIPGHGGLLDRLDGFVAAIVVAAVIGFMRGGVDGVGRGLMVW
jgi:phosphatidate cytidylyltransferase